MLIGIPRICQVTYVIAVVSFEEKKYQNSQGLPLDVDTWGCSHSNLSLSLSTATKAYLEGKYACSSYFWNRVSVKQIWALLEESFASGFTLISALPPSSGTRIEGVSAVSVPHTFLAALPQFRFPLCYTFAIHKMLFMVETFFCFPYFYVRKVLLYPAKNSNIEILPDLNFVMSLVFKIRFLEVSLPVCLKSRYVKNGW